MEKSELLNELNEVSKKGKRKRIDKSMIEKSRLKKDNAESSANTSVDTSYVINENGEKIEIPSVSAVMKNINYDNEKFNSVSEEIKSKTDWGVLLSMIDKDPIDDITGKSKYSYKNKDEDDEYKELFSEEYSMISSVINQLQEEGKNIKAQLKNLDIGRKSVGRMSQPAILMYSELHKTLSKITETQLRAISELINVKKTASDLKIKAKKDEGTEKESTLEIADSYYKQIMSGGAGVFSNNLLKDVDNNGDGNVYEDEDIKLLEGSLTAYDKPGAFNPSQALYEGEPNMSLDDLNEVDPYGYMRHENENIRIIVEIDDDIGVKKFTAIDEDGLEVSDYELPDKSLLDTMNIDPYSEFVMDRYGRRYKVSRVSERDLINTDE